MRAWLAALGMALALWTPALAQQLLSPVEFRDAGIAMIRAEDPSAEIEIRDELGINVRRPHQSKERSEFFLNFDSAYRQYQSAPEALTDILGRYVRIALAPPDSTPTLERVVAVVRTRERIEGYNAAFAQMSPPAQIVARPLAGDLYAVIVYDSAEAVQIATAESLRELDLSTDQAWDLAHRNTPDRMGELEIGSFADAPGLTYITGGNGLAPSSLLRADFCVGAHAEDMFLAPDREGYWRADSDVAGALDFFRGFARHLIRTGQSESSALLVCRDNRLVSD